MKTILYYGVENTTAKATSFEGTPFPHYTKGAWAHQLKDTEDEAEARAIIEKRCRANPDGAMACGIKTAHFYWIT